MKKICAFFASVLFLTSAYGQTVANAGLETWHSGLAGFPFPTVPVTAPNQWYGSDSLAITFGPIIFTGSTDWNRQLFKETSFVHSGSAAAKLMTAMEGDLGFFPGSLSNAKIVVDLAAAGSDPANAISFQGGTAVTVQPTTVSAWLAYFPGIDTVTDTIGYDEGLVTVQVIATIGVIDSTVGTGFATVVPSDVYTEVTVPVTYTTTDYPVHTLRLIFASSADPTAALDSSTLYVDDVSYTGVPNPPPPIKVQQVNNSEVVRVYPNPATGKLYIHSKRKAGNFCSLLSVTGQVVASMPLTGEDQMDIAAIPAGCYIYRITDGDGKNIQQGKLNVY
jgi:hypothetical protein